MVQCYEDHKKPVTNLAFNPNGHYVATTSVDGTIKIIDLRIGQMLYKLKGHEVNIRTLLINFLKPLKLC